MIGFTDHIALQALILQSHFHSPLYFTISVVFVWANFFVHLSLNFISFLNSFTIQSITFHSCCLGNSSEVLQSTHDPVLVYMHVLLPYIDGY
jgi:hypothetical protein